MATTNLNTGLYCSTLDECKTPVANADNTENVIISQITASGSEIISIRPEEATIPQTQDVIIPETENVINSLTSKDDKCRITKTGSNYSWMTPSGVIVPPSIPIAGEKFCHHYDSNKYWECMFCSSDDESRTPTPEPSYVEIQVQMTTQPQDDMYIDQMYIPQDELLNFTTEQRHAHIDRMTQQFKTRYQEFLNKAFKFKDIKDAEVAARELLKDTQDISECPNFNPLEIATKTFATEQGITDVIGSFVNACCESLRNTWDNVVENGSEKASTFVKDLGEHWFVWLLRAAALAMFIYQLLKKNYLAALMSVVPLYIVTYKEDWFTWMPTEWNSASNSYKYKDTDVVDFTYNSFPRVIPKQQLQSIQECDGWTILNGDNLQVIKETETLIVPHAIRSYLPKSVNTRSMNAIVDMIKTAGHYPAGTKEQGFEFHLESVPLLTQVVGTLTGAWNSMANVPWVRIGKDCAAYLTLYKVGLMAVDAFKWIISNVSLCLFGRDPFDVRNTELAQKIDKNLNELRFFIDSDKVTVSTASVLVREYQLALELQPQGLLTLPNWIMSTYTQEINLKRRLYIEAKNVLESDVSRIEPVGILLVGDSGLGKTTLANELSKTLFSALLEPTIDEDHKPLQLLKAINRNDQYVSGYHNQPSVLLDEMFQSTDKDFVRQELLLWISMVNSATLNLNMAGVEEKGKTFTSSFVFGTTNANNFPGDLISQPEAFYRRAHLIILVIDKVKGIYAVNSGVPLEHVLRYDKEAKIINRLEMNDKVWWPVNKDPMNRSRSIIQTNYHGLVSICIRQYILNKTHFEQEKHRTATFATAFKPEDFEKMIKDAQESIDSGFVVHRDPVIPPVDTTVKGIRITEHGLDWDHPPSMVSSLKHLDNFAAALRDHNGFKNWDQAIQFKQEVHNTLLEKKQKLMDIYNTQGDSQEHRDFLKEFSEYYLRVGKFDTAYAFCRALQDDDATPAAHTLRHRLNQANRALDKATERFDAQIASYIADQNHLQQEIRTISDEKELTRKHLEELLRTSAKHTPEAKDESKPLPDGAKPSWWSQKFVSIRTGIAEKIEGHPKISLTVGLFSALGAAAGLYYLFADTTHKATEQSMTFRHARRGRQAPRNRTMTLVSNKPFSPAKASEQSNEHQVTDSVTAIQKSIEAINVCSLKTVGSVQEPIIFAVPGVWLLDRTFMTTNHYFRNKDPQYALWIDEGKEYQHPIIEYFRDEKNDLIFLRFGNRLQPRCPLKRGHFTTRENHIGGISYYIPIVDRHTRRTTVSETDKDARKGKLAFLKTQTVIGLDQPQYDTHVGPDSWIFNREGAQGECGTLYFDSEGKIMAMHVAGDDNHPTSFGVCLDATMYDFYTSILVTHPVEQSGSELIIRDSNGVRLNYTPGIEFHPPEPIPESLMQIVGTIPKNMAPSINMKSKIRKTTLYGMFGDVNLQVAPLNGPSMNRGLTKFVDRPCVDKVKYLDVIKMKFFKHIPPTTNPITQLSFTESLQGTDVLNHVATDTAAGYPFNTTGPAKKNSYLHFDPDGQLIIDRPEFVEAYELFEHDVSQFPLKCSFGEINPDGSHGRYNRSYISGCEADWLLNPDEFFEKFKKIKPVVVNVANLKDETLPKTKEFARTLQYSGAFSTILGRALTHEFQKSFLKDPVNTFTGIGINVHGVEPHLVYRRFAEAIEILVGDFESLDRTIRGNLMEIICDLILEWHWRSGATPEFLNKLWVYLWLTLRYPVYMWAKFDENVLIAVLVLMANGTNPTGFCMTAIINTIATEIVLNDACIDQMVTETDCTPFEAMQRIIDIIYGDDDVLATIKHKLNPATLRDYILTQFGMKITNIKKNGPPEMVPLSEISFLSRDFSLPDFRAPLSLETLYGILYFSKDRKNHLVMQSQINAFCYELSHFTEEEYNKHYEVLRQHPEIINNKFEVWTYEYALATRRAEFQPGYMSGSVATKSAEQRHGRVYEQGWFDEFRSWVTKPLPMISTSLVISSYHLNPVTVINTYWTLCNSYSLNQSAEHVRRLCSWDNASYCVGIALAVKNLTGISCQSTALLEMIDIAVKSISVDRYRSLSRNFLDAVVYAFACYYAPIAAKALLGVDLDEELFTACSTFKFSAFFINAFLAWGRDTDIPALRDEHDPEPRAVEQSFEQIPSWLATQHQPRERFISFDRPERRAGTRYSRIVTEQSSKPPEITVRRVGEISESIQESGESAKIEVTSDTGSNTAKTVANENITFDGVSHVDVTVKKGCTQLSDEGCVSTIVGPPTARQRVPYEPFEPKLPVRYRYTGGSLTATTGTAGTMLASFYAPQILFTSKEITDIAKRYAMLTFDSITIEVEITKAPSNTGSLVMYTSQACQDNPIAGTDTTITRFAASELPSTIVLANGKRYCLVLPWLSMYNTVDYVTEFPQHHQYNIVLAVYNAFSGFAKDTDKVTFTVFWSVAGLKFYLPIGTPLTINPTWIWPLEDDKLCQDDLPTTSSEQGVFEDFDKLPSLKLCASCADSEIAMAPALIDLRTKCAQWNQELGFSHTFGTPKSVIGFQTAMRDSQFVESNSRNGPTIKAGQFAEAHDYDTIFTYHPMWLVNRIFGRWSGGMVYRFKITAAFTTSGTETAPYVGDIWIKRGPESSIAAPTIRYPTENYVDFSVPWLYPVPWMPIAGSQDIYGDSTSVYNNFSLCFDAAISNLTMEIWSKIGDDYIPLGLKCMEWQIESTAKEQGWDLMTEVSNYTNQPTTELIAKMSSFARKFAMSPVGAVMDEVSNSPAIQKHLASAASAVRTWAGFSNPTKPIELKSMRATVYGTMQTVNSPVDLHGTVGDGSVFQNVPPKAFANNLETDPLSNAFLQDYWSYRYSTTFVNDSSLFSTNISFIDNLTNVPLGYMSRHRLFQNLYYNHHNSMEVALFFNASALTSFKVKIWLLPQILGPRTSAEFSGDYVASLPCHEVHVKGDTLVKYEVPYRSRLSASQSPQSVLLGLQVISVSGEIQCTVNVFTRPTKYWHSNYKGMALADDPGVRNTGRRSLKH